jgi:parvulin-like peptidyl-prolyl isomerase
MKFVLRHMTAFRRVAGDVGAQCTVKVLPVVCFAVGVVFFGSDSLRVHAQTTTLTKVIASIDGDPVTSRDLSVYVQDTYGGKAPQGKNADMLNEYILVQLLSREAAKGGYPVSPDDIDRYISKIKEQNGVDDAGLDRLLASQGLDRKTYRAQLQNEILKSKVLGQQLRNKVDVSEGEITKFIEEQGLGSSTSGQGKRRVEEMFLPFSNSEQRARMKEKADELSEILEDSTEPWAKVSPEFYVDLGEVSPEDLMPELKRALESLDDNEVSSVIETERGFYLLRATAAKATSTPDSLREKVRERLLKEKSEAHLKRFVDDELFKKYNVERY